MTLDDAAQKAVVAFAESLAAQKRQSASEKTTDFSFLENVFGALSDEEADEMRLHCKLQLDGAK